MSVRHRLRGTWLGLGLALLVLALPSGALAHYTPQSGDQFTYSETVVLDQGVGNYTGYSENSAYTGSIHITSVLPNLTESASYQSSGTYQNSLGQGYPWAENGSFTFSASTFHYVQGTDNQTGYVNPFVWFFIDGALANGSAVTILNTPSLVISNDLAYPSPLSSTGYAKAVYVEGSGSYQRNDVYGVFTASYTWQAYYDPTTGYALGYTYTETDSDAAGDGFRLIDTAHDTQASFPVTAVSAPPPSGPPLGNGASSAFSTALAVALIVIVVLVVVVVVAVVLARRRHPSSLPRHSIPANPPMYAPPPPINLVPSGQPVPQVVLRETVRVPCRFCGTLIDSTALNCPKCGAPRT